MSTDDPTLAPDVRAKALADEYTQLAEQADRIKQRQDQIKQLLAELLPTGGGHVGDYTVKVARPHRINPSAVENAFPVATHPWLYKPTIDTAAVRKHIAEVDLTPYMTEGKPVVTIK